MAIDYRIVFADLIFKAIGGVVVSSVTFSISNYRWICYMTVGIPRYNTVTAVPSTF
jgi:hypothetical protein